MGNQTKPIIGTVPLVIILLLIKLCGVNISWLWVFSPIWIPFALGFFFLAIIAISTIFFLLGLLIIGIVATIKGE